MVDISALMKALPVSSLEPDCVALLGGFHQGNEDRRWETNISLLEPPAGQRVPYIEPVQALEKLLRHQYAPMEDANSGAHWVVEQMKAALEPTLWVHFLDDVEPDSPPCLPLPDFVGWLREEFRAESRMASSTKLDWQGFKEVARAMCLVKTDIRNFLEQAAEVVTRTPMFHDQDAAGPAWSLETLPALPPPRSMVEFLPGPLWAEPKWGDWKAGDNPFLRWRESMRPIARNLERVLGEPVYHFADLSCDVDDDAVHRFLVLHWCSSHKPTSAYVRYLVKVSGARDVEELKAALIDPASYTQPFKLRGALDGLEVSFCRINYLPANTQRTVGFVFFTPQAREVAQTLLAQQIRGHIVIVAPTTLVDDAWERHATRHCIDWSVRRVHEDRLDEPITLLASIDELCVIANQPAPKHGFDLMLPEQAEDLLCLALALGVEARYHDVEGKRILNPQDALQRQGAIARMAARQSQRAAFTRQLTEIRLVEDEYESSGLSDADDCRLSLDDLDLPLGLIRRIAAWQKEYDDTHQSWEMSEWNRGFELRGEVWWEYRRRDAYDLAKDLQAVVGDQTVVKLKHRREWTSVNEVD